MNVTTHTSEGNIEQEATDIKVTGEYAVSS